jgi:hypothetical protein
MHQYQSNKYQICLVNTCSAIAHFDNDSDVTWVPIKWFFSGQECSAPRRIVRSLVCTAWFIYHNQSYEDIVVRNFEVDFSSLRVSKQSKQLIVLWFWVVFKARCQNRHKQLLVLPYLSACMELCWTPTVRIFMKFEFRIIFRISVNFFLLLLGPQGAKKLPFIFVTRMCTLVVMTTCYTHLSKITSVHFTTSNPIN